jgi:MFS family permease
MPNKKENVFSFALLKSFAKGVKLSPGITALYSNIVIDQIGSGLIGLFMPIFLWQKFGNLNRVLLYYLVVWVGYSVLVFFGAKLMSVVGLKMSMILSVPFKLLNYGCLYYLSLGYAVLPFTILMIVAMEARMMLFWVPYHTDFAKFTHKANRGRVMAFLSSISSLVAIVIPIIAGWIIISHGFNVLFLISSVLIGVSIVPLFLVRPTFEKFTFSFKETWVNLFGRRHRRMVLSRFADGIQTIIGAVVWPIFIFQVLNGDFLKVGAISSAIVLITVVLKLVMGSYTDKFSKRKLLHWGSAFYAIGWIFKMFVSTGFEIFIASSYHNLTSVVMRTPMDALLYEKASDSGHYVDEMTVLREIAVNLGKAIGILIIFAVVGALGFQWAFILAAVASLFINLL